MVNAFGPRSATWSSCITQYGYLPPQSAHGVLAFSSVAILQAARVVSCSARRAGYSTPSSELDPTISIDYVQCFLESDSL
jgi:hypothetical protein